jgi:hypothetical protein
MCTTCALCPAAPTSCVVGLRSTRCAPQAHTRHHNNVDSSGPPGGTSCHLTPAVNTALTHTHTQDSIHCTTHTRELPVKQRGRTPVTKNKRSWLERRTPPSQHTHLHITDASVTGRPCLNPLADGRQPSRPGTPTHLPACALLGTVAG